MKNGAPWSVKGIEPEARETAKAEARKMGQTLGQWLNQVIKENSRNQTGEDQAAPAGAGDSVNNVHKRLEDLARELAQISQDKAATESRAPLSAETRDDKIARALNELSNRFELSERQTAELLSEFRDDLNLLAQNVSPLQAPEPALAPQPHMAPAAPAEMPSAAANANQEMKTLEQALALVVDHIELTDKRNGEVLKSLQSRLSDVTARLGVPGPEPRANPNPNLNKIAELEQRISQLAALSGQGAPASAPDAKLKALQDSIASLSQNLDQMRASAQPSKAISSLNNRYEELATRLYETEQHIPDQEQVNAIETRLKELAGRLEQSLESSNPHPQITDLENRISELAVQLESAQDQQRWEEFLPKIDKKFGQINSRLDETEQRFKTLDGFEGRIDQLFKGLEETRANVGETARMAAEQAIKQITGEVVQQSTQAAVQQSTQAAVQQASKMAQEIAGKAIAQYAEQNRTAMQEAAELAATQAVAKMGGAGVSDEQIKSAFGTLEQGLDDVRANSDAVEKRTQDTLQSVHESLEKVMERLNSLEVKTARGPDESAALYDGHEGGSEGAGADLRLPPIHEPASENPDSALHLNEGLDQIYGAGNVSGDPGTDSQPPLRSAYAPMGGVNRNEDFIAAARRAAKTAAELPAFGEESDSLPGDNVPNSKKSTLGNLFRANRRPLLYTVAAIALLGGLYVVSGMIGGDDPQVTVSETVLETPAPAGTGPNEAARLAEPPKAAGQDQPGEAAAPAAMAKKESPAPVIDKAMPAPVKAKTSAKPAAMDAAPAPSSTNSIPPARPIARSARPAIPALPGSGGSSVIPKSKSKALVTGDLPASLGTPALRAAAMAGNPNAQYEVAAAYATGQGVEKDVKKALTWYRKAAARGLPMAQYRLGTMYEKGRGVSKDRAAARIWYSRAAVKGNRKAMHNLAVMNAEGGDDGTKPDFTKAAQWFRKAAELGLTDSQFNLAILSERGLGVPQSQIEAYKWFALAQQNGDKDAAARLDTIANQLDSKTLVKARMAVKRWTAKPINTAANRIVVPEGGWQNAVAVAIPSEDNLIKNAQSLLSQLGYRPGPADGLMGENTREAVMKFQSNEGMSADGRITPELIARLKAAIG